MPTSYGDTIFTAALNVLQNIPWTAQGMVTMPPGNVKRRMLPDVRAVLDGLPCVILAASSIPESEEIVSFEGHKNVVWAAEVAVVAGGNADYVTLDPLIRSWQEQIKRAFGDPRLDGAPSVWDTRISPGPLFDHSLLNQQYTFTSVTIRFSSCEPRV